jgi:methylated-DNA-protein-cysteine methyltransferase-like protein
VPRREKSDSYERIYAVVSKIPRGKIATYGQVAELAGLSGHARQVGYALHATPDEIAIPWQRVVNAKGEISPRADPLMAGVQKSLLDAEGVSFDANGRIDLARCRWQPRLHSFLLSESERKRSQKGRKR